MNKKQKRVVYLCMLSAALVLFAAGLVSGYLGRNTPICKDHKPPRQQQDTGIGQIEYLCQNGEIVTK